MLTPGGTLSPWRAIALGWAQVSKDISRAVVATALSLFFGWLIGLVIKQFIPAVLPFVVGVEIGIFRTGFLYFFLRSARGESRYKDIFAGFSRFLKPSALAAAFITAVSFYWLGLMMGSGIALAITLLITLAVETAFGFTYVIIANGESAWWWGALDRSKRLVLPRFKEILVLMLVLAGFNALGLVFAGVGVLVTLPISFCALIEVYRGMAAEAPASQ